MLLTAERHRPAEIATVDARLARVAVGEVSSSGRVAEASGGAQRDREEDGGVVEGVQAVPL